MYLRWIATGVTTLALASTVGVAAVRARAGVDVSASERVLPVTGGAALPPRTAPPVVFGDSMLGESGALRARFVDPALAATLLGADTISATAWSVPGGIDGHPFTFLPMRAFSLKVGSWVGGYYMGYWPAERRGIHDDAYRNPVGFIEVTPANEDTYVSAHFRLRDFLTHDQARVWPKYVVLREQLLDKLELVLQDLSAHGINTSHVIVLSGFRTPAYNFALGDASGRARESRHQYGDAADIIIDADGDGRMDDLDLDGHVDTRDVRVIERAVERVEQRYPDLVGGLGLYQALGPHGPFAHIDVRGELKRWTGGPHAPALAAADPNATRVGGCYATGASAVLCLRVHHRAR